MMLRLHTVSSSCVVDSFTMFLLVLVRVEYLAGHLFTLDISGTEVLLAV